MDSGNNNKGGFTINFGPGTRRGTSKGFKDAYSDLKRKIIIRDSNRKGKNPFFILLVCTCNNVRTILSDAACT